MEEENKETNVKSTIDAVTGLVKAVPVYQDAVQPAAKQVGQSLEVVAKTVNIALAPIKALVWGYEKIEDFISKSVSEKLKSVPEENITTPPPNVAGPAVESLRYSGHDEKLRELYANLIANAMDKDTIHKAHPGFVEIIKNLSTDEAVLLKVFIKKQQFPLIDIKATITEKRGGYTIITQNFSHISKLVELTRPDLIPTYINNLCRLGILEIPSGVYMSDSGIYESLESDKQLEPTKMLIEQIMKRKMDFTRKVVSPTMFGKQFIENVVKDK
ncbi:MAG: DUF4393 domain-containing protein [Flavobacteriaceae bacterium]|nr:DUF4393 domain-containing protein [Flavobacteriaceae bacterium]